jgi:hypothetical protein
VDFRGFRWHGDSTGNIRERIQRDLGWNASVLRQNQEFSL